MQWNRDREFILGRVVVNPSGILGQQKTFVCVHAIVCVCVCVCSASVFLSSSNREETVRIRDG